MIVQSFLSPRMGTSCSMRSSNEPVKNPTFMNSSHDDMWAGEAFRALRRHDADNAGGFVCILDLRDLHAGGRKFSLGQLLALAALIAFVVLIANACLSVQSDSAPRADDDTGKIIESTSTPIFSPDTILPPTPLN